MPEFPAHGSRHDELQNHRRMETSFTISIEGRIDAITKVWTSDPWKGFTGSVVVFLTDSAGNIIHATDTYRYGVDGVRVGDPSREAPWNESIPEEVLNKMSGYAIWQAHTPVPRITPDVFREWSEAIAPIIEIFSAGVSVHSTPALR